MIVKLLTEHHLEFLSIEGGCTGSSESTLVKMPHCWKSHVTAHMHYLIKLSPSFENGFCPMNGNQDGRQNGQSLLVCTCGLPNMVIYTPFLQIIYMDYSSFRTILNMDFIQ